MARIDRKELLWESYSELMNRSWFEFLYPIITDTKFQTALKFVHRRRKENVEVFPADHFLFHPFRFSSPEECTCVILGRHGPCDYEVNDNLSLPLHVHSEVPEQSLKVLAELRRTKAILEVLAQKKYRSGPPVVPINIAKEELKDLPPDIKTTKIQQLLKAHAEMKQTSIMEMFKDTEDEFPFESVASQGALLLNSCFTLEDSERKHQHSAIWAPVVKEILRRLSTKYPGKYYVTFEPANFRLLEDVDKQKNRAAYHKDPFGSNIFQKINQYILKEYQDESKIIDWTVVLHLLQKADIDAF